MRWTAVQRTEHVRVACWRLATADTDWLVAFAWAARADHRSAAQRVRWGPELDSERYRAHQDWAARWAQDDERAAGGEAEKRRRIPAYRLPRFAFKRTAAMPVPNKRGGEKTTKWFEDLRFGARSAAGSMTPLSLAYAGARTQIPDAPLPAENHGAHLALAV
jgi:hypothetical protein